MNKKILIIGSFFQDLVFYCEDFPKPGQTLKGSFQTGMGGKGSNQAIAAQKLSNDVHFISAIGKDQFGQSVSKQYDALGLSYFLVESDKPTGCAGIYVNKQGQNQIIISQGAMDDLSLNKIKQNLDEALQSAKLIIFQAELDFNNLKEIMKYCHVNKSIDSSILFNPAPFRLDYVYEEIMEFVQIFVPNETEYEAVQKVVNLSKCQLIVTLGEKGCLLNDKIISGYQVTAIDTTGAGDCWIGAFSSQFINGKSLSYCCQYANKAASISVTRLGTASSMPNKDEINDL